MMTSGTNDTRRLATATALAMLGTMLASPSVAQNASPDSARARFSIGSAQTIAGMVHVTSSDLDRRLGAAGLPRAAASAATVGFGADLRAGRLLVGASWQSMLTRNQSDASYRTRLSGDYALFDVGFAALQSDAFSIYPMVGVGATRLSLGVKERGDFTFDDGLDRPGREISMSGTSALMHAGVLVQRQFVRKSGSRFALDVRAGITRSIGSQSWQSDENRVKDGPTGVRGSYVRIGFSKPLRSRRDAALPMAVTVLQTALR
jgi:hypothetical protein